MFRWKRPRLVLDARWRKISHWKEFQSAWTQSRQECSPHRLEARVNLLTRRRRRRVVPSYLAQPGAQEGTFQLHWSRAFLAANKYLVSWRDVEIAAIAIYLASPAAAYTNGQDIALDGSSSLVNPWGANLSQKGTLNKHDMWMVFRIDVHEIFQIHVSKSRLLSRRHQVYKSVWKEVTQRRTVWRRRRAPPLHRSPVSHPVLRFSLTLSSGYLFLFKAWAVRSLVLWDFLCTSSSYAYSTLLCYILHGSWSCQWSSIASLI